MGSGFLARVKWAAYATMHGWDALEILSLSYSRRYQVHFLAMIGLALHDIEITYMKIRFFLFIDLQ